MDIVPALEKSNARVTISAALAAGVACWDDSGNAHLPPGSLFIGCGQDLFFSGLQILAEDTAPWSSYYDLFTESGKKTH